VLHVNGVIQHLRGHIPVNMICQQTSLSVTLFKGMNGTFSRAIFTVKCAEVAKVGLE